MPGKCSSSVRYLIDNLECSCSDCKFGQCKLSQWLQARCTQLRECIARAQARFEAQQNRRETELLSESSKNGDDEVIDEYEEEVPRVLTSNRMSSVACQLKRRFRKSKARSDAREDRLPSTSRASEATLSLGDAVATFDRKVRRAVDSLKERCRTLSQSEPSSPVVPQGALSKDKLLQLLHHYLDQRLFTVYVSSAGGRLVSLRFLRRRNTRSITIDDVVDLRGGLGEESKEGEGEKKAPEEEWPLPPTHAELLAGIRCSLNTSQQVHVQCDHQGPWIHMRLKFSRSYAMVLKENKPEPPSSGVLCGLLQDVHDLDEDTFEQLEGYCQAHAHPAHQSRVAAPDARTRQRIKERYDKFPALYQAEMMAFRRQCIISLLKPEYSVTDDMKSSPLSPTVSRSSSIEIIWSAHINDGHYSKEKGNVKPNEPSSLDDQEKEAGFDMARVTKYLMDSCSLHEQGDIPQNSVSHIISDKYTRDESNVEEKDSKVPEVQPSRNHLVHHNRAYEKDKDDEVSSEGTVVLAQDVKPKSYPSGALGSRYEGHNHQVKYFTTTNPFTPLQEFLHHASDPSEDSSEDDYVDCSESFNLYNETFTLLKNEQNQHGLKDPSYNSTSLCSEEPDAVENNQDDTLLLSTPVSVNASIQSDSINTTNRSYSSLFEDPYVHHNRFDPPVSPVLSPVSMTSSSNIATTNNSLSINNPTIHVTQTTSELTKSVNERDEPNVSTNTSSHQSISSVSSLSSNSSLQVSNCSSKALNLLLMSSTTSNSSSPPSSPLVSITSDSQTSSFSTSDLPLTPICSRKPSLSAGAAASDSSPTSSPTNHSILRRICQLNDSSIIQSMAAQNSNQVRPRSRTASVSSNKSSPIATRSRNYSGARNLLSPSRSRNISGNSNASSSRYRFRTTSGSSVSTSPKPRSRSGSIGLGLQTMEERKCPKCGYQTWSMIYKDYGTLDACYGMFDRHKPFEEYHNKCVGCEMKEEETSARLQSFSNSNAQDHQPVESSSDDSFEVIESEDGWNIIDHEDANKKDYAGI